MLENGIDENALPPEQAAKLKMLLNAFDRNHNGKIDPEERPAVVDFLMKRYRNQDQQPNPTNQEH
jgi:Ca2+-binding EF-hand superfamily protein